MAIDIRGLGNQEALSQIAKLAYGSGTFEKTSGGKGNIGLLNGRAVKFNTHYSERGGTVSDEMRASCNELRRKLSEIATTMLSAPRDASPEQRTAIERTLAKVRAQLGMSADGADVATTSLLDRKVVASVINVLRDATGFDAWQGLRGTDARSLSSQGVDTHFDKVAYDISLKDALQLHVQGALDAIRNPTDGKPGVALDAKATKFLMDLVERDFRDPTRREALSIAEVGRAIRDFTSPHLIVTLQAFNLHSEVLTHVRPRLRRGEQGATLLSGSPDNQRADRADVALSLLAEASGNNKDTNSCFALALVSEKMTEMRRIQPKGRLTGATVWKACFGEKVPTALTDSFGSQAFSDAFFKRLFRLGNSLLAKYGGLKMCPDMTFTQMSGLFMTKAFSGMAFTAGIRLGAEDPTFTLNAARDFVSTPPLYKIEDARVKTDNELREQLAKDFYRDTPIVTLHDGENEETFDFSAAFAEAQQGEGPREEGQGVQSTPRDRFGVKVNAFVRAFDARYGAQMTPIQRQLVLLGMTQAGLAPFAALANLRDDAHSKMSFDIRREDDGAFVISYMTDRERNDVDVRYSYRIEPDGTNYRVGDTVYNVSFEGAAEKD